MYTKNSTQTLKPHEVWDYFIKHKEELESSMEPIAENGDFDVVIYLTNEKGSPALFIESSNFDSTDVYIENDEESCLIAIQDAYKTYLTDEVVNVIMESVEADREDDIEDRESDLTSITTRFIEDILGESPILYSDLIEDVIEDCKEHFLEYMYRKHHLDIYRPMELEDDDGVFFEEYPYEYIEFSDAPLYNNTK